MPYSLLLYSESGKGPLAIDNWAVRKITTHQLDERFALAKDKNRKKGNGRGWVCPECSEGMDISKRVHHKCCEEKTVRPPTRPVPGQPISPEVFAAFRALKRGPA